MNQLNFLGNDLRARFGDEATLGQVFRAIETDLKLVGEVVCQFKVNGLSLDEDSERRLGPSLLSEVQDLAVVSQKPSEILDGVVENWAKKLPMMLANNDQLAQDVRFKGVEGRLKALVDLIDDCQLLVDSLISIDQVFPQLDLVQSEQWKIAERQMANTIGEALQAFQKKDYTLLSDVLEYDMGHSIQVWMDLLPKLLQSANVQGKEDAGANSGVQKE